MVGIAIAATAVVTVRQNPGVVALIVAAAIFLARGATSRLLSSRPEIVLKARLVACRSVVLSAFLGLILFGRFHHLIVCGLIHSARHEPLVQ